MPPITTNVATWPDGFREHYEERVALMEDGKATEEALRRRAHADVWPKVQAWVLEQEYGNR